MVDKKDLSVIDRSFQRGKEFRRRTGRAPSRKEAQQLTRTVVQETGTEEQKKALQEPTPVVTQQEVIEQQPQETTIRDRLTQAGEELSGRAKDLSERATRLKENPESIPSPDDIGKRFASTTAGQQIIGTTGEFETPQGRLEQTPFGVGVRTEQGELFLPGQGGFSQVEIQESSRPLTPNERRQISNVRQGLEEDIQTILTAESDQRFNVDGQELSRGQALANLQNRLREVEAISNKQVPVQRLQTIRDPQLERTGIRGNPSASLLGLAEGFEEGRSDIQKVENLAIAGISAAQSKALELEESLVTSRLEDTRLTTTQRSQIEEAAEFRERGRSGSVSITQGFIEGVRPSNISAVGQTVTQTSADLIRSDLTTGQVVVSTGQALLTKAKEDPLRFTGEIIGSAVLFGGVTKALSAGKTSSLQIRGAEGTRLGAELTKQIPAAGRPASSFAVSKGRLLQISQKQFAGGQTGKVVTVTPQGQVFVTRFGGKTAISKPFAAQKTAFITEKVVSITTKGGKEAFVFAKKPVLQGRLIAGGQEIIGTAKTSTQLTLGKLELGKIAAEGFKVRNTIKVADISKTELLRTTPTSQGITQVTRSAGVTATREGVVGLTRSVATTDIVKAISRTPGLRSSGTISSGSGSGAALATAKGTATSTASATGKILGSQVPKLLPSQSPIAALLPTPGSLTRSALQSIPRVTAGAAAVSRIRTKPIQQTRPTIAPLSSTTQNTVLKTVQRQPQASTSAISTTQGISSSQSNLNLISQASGTSSKQTQTQLERTATTQQQRQSLRQVTQNISLNTIVTPPITTSRLFLATGKRRSRPAAEQEPGFDTQVRFKGKFRKVNRKPLSRANARKLGTIVVDEASPRSFRIKPTKRPASDTQVSGSSRLNKFRKAKRNNNIFVERRRHAIDSPGERKEITLEGLKAQARQRLVTRAKSSLGLSTPSRGITKLIGGK